MGGGGGCEKGIVAAAIGGCGGGTDGIRGGTEAGFTEAAGSVRVT